MNDFERAVEAMDKAEQVIPWLVGQLAFAVKGLPVRDMTESTEAARIAVEAIREARLRRYKVVEGSVDTYVSLTPRCGDTRAFFEDPQEGERRALLLVETEETGT